LRGIGLGGFLKGLGKYINPPKRSTQIIYAKKPKEVQAGFI
jgi:hypothetical protein